VRILRTIPVDHTIFCFRYPDLHHRLLGIEPHFQWFHRALSSSPPQTVCSIGLGSYIRGLDYDAETM
jgi:hypothetical protein